MFTYLRLNFQINIMKKTLSAGIGRLSIYAAMWVISYITSLLIIKKLSPGVEWGIILSIIPIVIFALFLRSITQYISNLDEVQIRVQMEASVIAFLLGLVMLMTLGLLDLVIVLNPENWGYRHLIPFFVLYYIIGLIISLRKYSVNNEELP